MIKIQHNEAALFRLFDGSPSNMIASGRRAARPFPVGRLVGDSRRVAQRRSAGAALLLACTALGCAAQLGGVEREAIGDGRVLITAERPLMGTRFRIDVIVSDEGLGERAIAAAFAEIDRFEEALSNWSESSQISEVNRSAGAAPVVVGHELMTVLDRALAVAELTGGAFDITFASCDGLWSIRDRRVPTEEEITDCLPRIDYRRVSLDPQRPAVFIADPATQIGIAGLAKGYRIDRAAQVMERLGIFDYVVDGGGDMRVAASAAGEPWEITVAHPRLDTPMGTVSLSTGAVATSGDYQWYFERDGVRYHHIIDPSTGLPARRSASATVIAATALEADALATGLFVIGPDEGILLAERLAGVEALIIGPDLSVHATSGFPPLVTGETTFEREAQEGTQS
jgi:thiamine biosynthesis lipoprotein